MGEKNARKEITENHSYKTLLNSAAELQYLRAMQIGSSNEQCARKNTYRTQINTITWLGAWETISIFRGRP